MISRGSFTPPGDHPEERSDEGSHEILPRFARQDEGTNVEKIPRPLTYNRNPMR